MNSKNDRSSSVEIHDLEAMEIISNLITYSTGNTVDVFALSEVRRRFMGKNSVEDLCPIGSVGYCRDLHKDNPEHVEGFRFREIYQRDDSFVNKGIGFGDKVVIDTSVQRKTGLVCIQIGDYPLLAFARESADTMLFTFPNPFFNCFTCLKENLDRTVKFIGVPVLEV